MNAMSLPNKIDSLCADWPWAPEWETAFGEYKYFYIAGLNELLFDKLSLKHSKQREAFLKKFANKRSYPDDWLAVFPGETCLAYARLNGLEESLENDLRNLYRHRDRLVRDRLGGKSITAVQASVDKSNGQLVRAASPVPFGRAVLIMIALDEGLKEEAIPVPDLTDRVKIKFANSYVHKFTNIYLDHVYRKEDSEVVKQLVNATKQLNADIFEEVARGYPVTKTLATEIIKFCSANFTSVDRLEIRPYDTRKGNDLIEPEKIREMRPAKNERVLPD